MSHGPHRLRVGELSGLEPWALSGIRGILRYILAIVILQVTAWLLACAGDVPHLPNELPLLMTSEAPLRAVPFSTMNPLVPEPLSSAGGATRLMKATRVVASVLHDWSDRAPFRRLSDVYPGQATKLDRACTHCQ